MKWAVLPVPEWDAKMSLDIRKTSYNNLLENTSLLSPINGVVTARNYDSGDMYSGGPFMLCCRTNHSGETAYQCF